MAVNIALDEKLIEEARQVGQQTSYQAAVIEALREYIERRRQLQLVSLFGTIDYDPKYDYKEQRQKT